MGSPSSDSTVATTTASDGRTLAWASYGDPDGLAVLYFHGTSTCRLDGGFFDAAATRAGVHLIAVDRPGSARSDPHPGRRLIDWPSDVDAVADALNIDRYVVTGMSGGGPHALACAALNPQRVIAAVPINSATPNDPAFLRAAPAPMRVTPFLMRNVPPLGRAMLRAMGKASGRPNMPSRGMPADWREVLAHDDIRAQFLAAREEGLRQTRTVWATEGALFWDPDGWGFDPIHLPVPVIGCSGVLDPSLEFTRRVVASSSPGSRMLELPGGHIHPLLPDVAQTVVDAMAAAGS